MIELLTSLLDLVGALLLVAAVMVLLWAFSPAGALAAGGAGLLVLSLLIDWRRARAARRLAVRTANQ
nr:hypothetical protein [uncultured Actinotalea sp.]